MSHSDPQHADEYTAETCISEKRIGERIKRLRLKKSMGLVEMGKHTGLSASFLSQLETGRVVPTLRNLARIAMVFNKDLSYFFETDPAPMFRIHKQADRIKLPQSGVESPSYFFENLGYMVPERQVDPYLAEFIVPKRKVDIKSHAHPGQEFLYMLKGRLEIDHGGNVYQLDEGDSAYFDATIPHSYKCAGKIPARAVLVTIHNQNGPRSVVRMRPIAQVTADGRSIAKQA